jgi:protein-tyrosine-phosphatase
MAEGLLRHRLAAQGLAAVVSSAGFRSAGVPATDDAVIVMAERGIDIGQHRSRKADVELLAEADLVLAMARLHVREAMVLAPDLLGRTFTLKEIVRRGEATGPREPGEDLATWLKRLGADRVPAGYLGDSRTDDIADPVGMPMRTYKKTAKELDGLLGRFVEVAWPG